LFCDAVVNLAEIYQRLVVLNTTVLNGSLLDLVAVIVVVDVGVGTCMQKFDGIDSFVVCGTICVLVDLDKLFENQISTHLHKIPRQKQKMPVLRENDPSLMPTLLSSRAQIIYWTLC
jgi:hypothetical protein